MGLSHPVIARTLSIGAVALAASSATHAQSASPAQSLLNDRFTVSAGVFLVGTDLRASLDGQSTTNPEIDFNRTVGRDNNATRGRIDALWRFAPHHAARFAYFNYNASQSRVIDRNINFGDTTFQAGGSLTANTKFSVYELDYEYAFLKQPGYEVAGTFGIHFTDLKLNLSGTGTVTSSSGTTSASGSVARESDLPMPLPVIGVRGGWVAAPNVLLDGRLQFFRLSSNGYDGNWSNAHIGGTWMFHRNWGVGLGYDWFTTRVDVSRLSYHGDLNLKYSGLQAFVTGSF